MLVAVLVNNETVLKVAAPKILHYSPLQAPPNPPPPQTTTQSAVSFSSNPNPQGGTLLLAPRASPP